MGVFVMASGWDGALESPEHDAGLECRPSHHRELDGFELYLKGLPFGQCVVEDESVALQAFLGVLRSATWSSGRAPAVIVKVDSDAPAPVEKLADLDTIWRCIRAGDACCLKLRGPFGFSFEAVDAELTTPLEIEGGNEVSGYFRGYRVVADTRDDAERMVARDVADDCGGKVLDYGDVGAFHEAWA